MKLNPAETYKEEGNDAFKRGEYGRAVSLYSFAIDLNPSAPVYYLNRSMALLKLKKWSQAEQDATRTLELDPKSTKAFYRRSMARAELGDLLHAREDMDAYSKMGGLPDNTKALLAAITAIEATGIELAQTPPAEQIPVGYRIGAAAGKGLGVFATQPFHRGDLILTEVPLFTIPRQDHGGRIDQEAVRNAVKTLSHDKLQQFLSLANSHAESGRFDIPNGIHSTNSFEIGGERSGIFVQVSRFNHSCSPNARYSWNTATVRERIYSLREIAVGEEITVSYLSARNVYGSTRQARQTRLASRNFICSCVACALQGEEAIASDKRRTEIAPIWEVNPYYIPDLQTETRLLELVRVIRLLKEEGYAADADDFTNDATATCAYHSDWESATYWARKTYEIRAAEFGIDGDQKAKARLTLLDLKTCDGAGCGQRRTCNVRL